MNEKKCNTCKIVKDISEFGTIGKNSNKPKHQCKSCFTQYSKKYVNKNRAAHYECSRRRKEARRIWFNETVKNQPCIDCGGLFPPCCMDFDHKPGFEKKSNPRNISWRGLLRKNYSRRSSKMRYCLRKLPSN